MSDTGRQEPDPQPQWEMPGGRPPRARPSKTTWPMLLVACLVGGVWSFVAMLMHDPGDAFRTGMAGAVWAYLAGYGVGQALLIAGILALALYFLFVRARAPDRGLRHFGALFASTLGGAGLAAVIILFVLGGARESDAALRQVFDTYDAQAQAREQRMAEELDANLGPDGNILTQGLSADADFDDMRRRVEAARTALESGEADVRALQDRTTAQLAEMELTEEQRQRAASLLRFGFLEENRARERLISTRVAILHHMEGQIDLLQQAQGRWRIVEGQIEFDRQTDHEAFAGYAHGIANLNADLQAEMAEVDQSVARGGENR